MSVSYSCTYQLLANTMTIPFAHGRPVSTYMGYEQDALLAQQMQANNVNLIVLTISDFMSVIRDKLKGRSPTTIASVRKAIAGTPLAEFWRDTFYPNATGATWVQPGAQAVVDVKLIAQVMYTLGFQWTKIIVKVNHLGNTIIILKGDPTQRKAFLQATRLLAGNVKLIKMGIGVRGTTRVAAGGFLLGLVVSIGIESLNIIFDDRKTMLDLVGAIGVEAVKGGLAAAFAAGVAAVVGTLTTVAVMPLLLMAVAVAVASIGLNWLDNKYGIKDAVIRALKESANEGASAARYLDNGVKAWIRRGY
jgi:hypothetical protein